MKGELTTYDLAMMADEAERDNFDNREIERDNYEADLAYDRAVDEEMRDEE